MSEPASDRVTRKCSECGQWFVCERWSELKLCPHCHEVAALRAALRELVEAAEDYRIHSELYPNVAGVDRSVRLIKARETAKAALSSATREGA